MTVWLMRNPDRIGQALYLLWQAWHKYPDTRFWQLLIVIKYLVESDTFAHEMESAWEYEDDRLIECLNNFLQREDK